MRSRAQHAIGKIRFRSRPLWTVAVHATGGAFLTDNARQKRLAFKTVHNCFCNCCWVIKASSQKVMFYRAGQGPAKRMSSTL
jgi:hypothetical protein